MKNINEEQLKAVLEELNASISLAEEYIEHPLVVKMIERYVGLIAKVTKKPAIEQITDELADKIASKLEHKMAMRKLMRAA